MLVPIAWLRDYIDLHVTTDEIAATLASLGFPVASTTRRPEITGVVAGRLAAVEKHPNADRLVVCTVDIAGAQPLTIATAATNVARGQIVPVATIGARLPEMVITPRKMRGVDSEGMLCSADELALEGEWFEDGIMQLDGSIRPGADIVEAFRLDDPILDVEVTPNRPDALCMVGIARELAAAYDLPLHYPETALGFDAAGTPDDGREVRVSLETPDARRFVAQRVTGVAVRTAPAWMRIRLALAGQRPINNLVDISNFVMLELGQPQHFYDFAKVVNGHIIVRDARPGERIVTLDGEERTLDPTALVIADEEQATGLAGLKGGQVNEVANDTTDLLIECATFNGPRIRRMSVALGLRTEASSRFEKKLPLAIADAGAARAAHLLASEGGNVFPPRVFGAALDAPAHVALAPREITRLLGYEAEPAEISQTLERLGFAVSAEEINGNVIAFDVTVPYWRTDIAIAADLVEEFARVAGYDRVVAEIPPIIEHDVPSTTFVRERDVATSAAALGYNEAITFALQPATIAERLQRVGVTVPKPLAIRNPLSEDQRWMRFSLFPALLELFARERTRPLAYCELGHVFFDDDGAQERSDAAFVRAAPSPFLAVKSDVAALIRAVTGRDAEFERATAPLFHPGKTAGIVLDDTVIGYVGVLDPRALLAFAIDDELAGALLFLDDLPAPQIPRYHAPSRFPAVLRDLAVVVDDDLSARALERAIRAVPDAHVASIAIFDEYRGPQVGAGKKSLALRLTLQRPDATMTDDDASAAVRRILDALATGIGATLRG